MEKKGCVVNNMIINHLMFADDIVLISPSSVGLIELIETSHQFGSKMTSNSTHQKVPYYLFYQKIKRSLIYPRSISIMSKYPWSASSNI